MPGEQFLNDSELMMLARSNVLVEGMQGLVKVDHSVAFSSGVKLRIGSIITGDTVLGEQCDIGLAGGAVIDNSRLGKDCAITGGGKIFNSIAGPYLRNYGSQMRRSRVGTHFVIRSMAEAKNLIAGNECKMKMFSRAYNSELGDANVIGSHSMLSDCVIGDNNEIGDYCSIENCRIGDKAKIGAYVHVRRNNEASQTILEDNCSLGDHVVVHPGSRIHAGMKIPDYALVFTRGGKTVMSLIDMDQTFRARRPQIDED